MLKIAVFGFYGPDQTRIDPRDNDYSLSPVNTDDFMRIVWEMEPPATRLRATPGAVCFVKLTGIAARPVYVQSLSNRMAPGVAHLNCDGYVAIIDAVKILAPKTIESALHRLADNQPRAHVIIAAGRQNEPDALSSDEIRQILGLHPDLPVYPYVPTEPKTAQRLIKRLARYIDDPNRVPPPIFAGESAPAAAQVATASGESPTARPDQTPAPHVHGLARLAIRVSHLERALDFYRGLLGFRLLGHIDLPNGQTITHLDAGRVLIELVSSDSGTMQPAPPDDDHCAGLRHLALRVTGLDAVAEQLSCAGIEFLQEPTTFGGVKTARITDPDGTLIELIEGDTVYTRR